ncbi:MAG: ATP synthase F0 subunit B [Clostridiales bacterium]|nr:ATP synthase F0 subunit B [Clostridiales bacterium]MBQ2816578.1 hypothetical protein [Clostridia bacterium]
MNIMAIIELLDDELSGASNFLLSGKKLVDVDKCLAMLSDLRVNLPESIIEAEAITQESDRIIRDAQANAEAIIAQAEQRFNAILSQHNIVNAANEQADQIIAQARAEAQDIRNDVMNYANNVLNMLQDNAQRVIEDVNHNRININQL